jgi:hypothetical protein
MRGVQHSRIGRLPGETGQFRNIADILARSGFTLKFKQNQADHGRWPDDISQGREG